MKVKIIYETQTGTTEYVAETMQKELTKAGHQVELHSVLKHGSAPILDGFDLILFGAPTYDDGKLEQAMKVFITKFQPDLSKNKVAVFGLGSRSYPLFCKAADFLEEWITKQQGKLAVPSLRIDGFPDDLTPITTWLGQLTGASSTP